MTPGYESDHRQLCYVREKWNRQNLFHRLTYDAWTLTRQLFASSRPNLASRVLPAEVHLEEDLLAAGPVEGLEVGVLLLLAAAPVRVVPEHKQMIVQVV